MANVNLHVLCFLGPALEDDVPGHPVLSRFRTQLTKVQAWDGLLEETNRQIGGRNLLAKPGCHVDAKADMWVAQVAQPGVDSEARWLKKAGKSVLAINNTLPSMAMA